MRKTGVLCPKNSFFSHQTGRECEIPYLCRKTT
jgi:hypothetical protein